MRTVTRKLAVAAAVCAAAATAAVMTVGTASADPTVTPAATDIVAVGSDTIQAFDNGLSTAYNATSPASNFYSWDATGTSPITPKTGAASIARPNGSGAGINALNGNTNATVDVARSSRGPNTGTTDLFIAFAKDAVGWAGYTGGNAPTNISAADLASIYSCGITQWNQIAGNSGGSTDTIKVFVPQNGSGTRTFFLTALGLNPAITQTCWQTTTPEENEGTDAAFDKDSIFPYSIAHFAGQVYHSKASGSDAPGVLDAYRQIDGNNQVDTVNQKIDSTFVTTAFGRNVYHVVRATDWADATEGPRLKALFGKSVSNGWLCKNGASLIASYGFNALPSAVCGTQTPGI